MNLEEKMKFLSRRDFLVKLIFGGGLIAGFLLLFRNGIAFLFPPKEKKVAQKLLIARKNELEIGKAKEFKVGDNSFFIVNTEDGLKVFSAICTHLGCKIKWEQYRNRFYCPCHQGVFDVGGKVVSGPPPRPLDEFRVEIKNNLVYMWLDESQGNMA